MHTITYRLPRAHGLETSLFMWWSVNTGLTTIPIGTLGQAFFSLTLP